MQKLGVIKYHQNFFIYSQIKYLANPAASCRGGNCFQLLKLEREYGNVSLNYINDSSLFNILVSPLSRDAML